MIEASRLPESDHNQTIARVYKNTKIINYPNWPILIQVKSIQEIIHFDDISKDTIRRMILSFLIR